MDAGHQVFDIIVTGKPVSEMQSPEEVQRTVAHEVGHTLGLFHPWSQKNTIEDAGQLGPIYNPNVFNNLLNSCGNPVTNLGNASGTSLTQGQRQKIDETISCEVPKKEL